MIRHKIPIGDFFLFMLGSKHISHIIECNGPLSQYIVIECIATKYNPITVSQCP